MCMPVCLCVCVCLCVDEPLSCEGCVHFWNILSEYCVTVRDTEREEGVCVWGPLPALTPLIIKTKKKPSPLGSTAPCYTYLLAIVTDDERGFVGVAYALQSLTIYSCDELYFFAFCFSLSYLVCSFASFTVSKVVCCWCSTLSEFILSSPVVALSSRPPVCPLFLRGVSISSARLVLSGRIASYSRLSPGRGLQRVSVARRAAYAV